MQYFNFRRLIEKYKKQFTAITLAEGYYDDFGDFVKGEETETVIQGAIIAFRESKVHRSEGTLTTQDRRLITLEPIDKALQGSKAIYEGNVYSIESESENADFTGVFSYTLKYCSAFKEKEGGDSE